MSAQRRVVRQAAQIVALVDQLRQGLVGDADELPHPVFWPALPPEEAEEEWDELRCWVDQVRERYPNLTRIPDCWWRHNDLVELLAALRDFERACFSATAPATAPVEWQRALRDMETRMEIWIKRLTCSVAGRGHDTPHTGTVRDAWTEFVRQDVDQRAAVADRESESGVTEPSDDRKGTR